MQSTYTSFHAAEPSSLRQVLAGVPTGLVVVAAEVEGRIVGLSANSFTSVSLEPPLVSVSFANTSTSWPLLRGAPRWGISVLGEHQAQVLQELRGSSHERFSGINMDVDAGAAHVVGALARLTVELGTEMEAGDHALTLLRVVSLERDMEQRPLIYFNSDVHRLSY